MHETIIEKERGKNSKVPEVQQDITIRILDQIKNFNKDIEPKNTKEQTQLNIFDPSIDLHVLEYIRKEMHKGKEAIPI